MAGRIVSQYERSLTTTVNDVEHIESSSYTGFGIVKIFFQPNVDVRLANAQVTAISQQVLKSLPPGTTPPLILNYNASTVPILQLALSGKGLSEQNLADLGLNSIRTALVTVQGAAIPYPFGGKTREVQIDLDPAALQARGLSGQDVANTLAAQNLIVPAGTQKIGKFEYSVLVNNAPAAIDALNDLPIKVVNGTMVYVRDVAHAHDGSAPQTNIVHVNGSKSVLISVLKSGATSTLSIIEGIKRKIQEIKPGLPDSLQISPIGDQSLFVRGAIDGVVREGVIAAALTSLMILLFLGSWRSTVIIAISIPLSILGAMSLLAACGETFNIMTLGGLALSIGILVDDATVTIENINWHLEQGKEVEQAILDGAAQILAPAFVSLLCICIAFVPMFFLDGIARFLFVPMAESVMFAMVCSFILSRTLVLTMAKFMLKPLHGHGVDTGSDALGEHEARAATRNPLVRFQRGFEARFESLRGAYHGYLGLALEHRRPFVLGFAAFILATTALVPFLGRNFFPAVDSGQILLHVRTQIGTRVEETSAQFTDIENTIRQLIPPAELATVADNIGTYVSSINTTYNNTGMIGSQDGDIQIELTAKHGPTAGYIKVMRERLPHRYPGVTFSFLPADIVSQILNFGAPAPINLQIRGPDIRANMAYAHAVLDKVRHVTGVADARIQQALTAPSITVDVDRTRAQFAGVTERDVVNSMVVNLAGSSQVAPTFWLNPKNGVSYSIVMQTPQYRVDSLAALENLPITPMATGDSQVLGGIADVGRTASSAVVSQYDIQPLVQIYASTQGRDLGSVAADIQKILDATKGDVPRAAHVIMLGQVQTMNSSFAGLLFGLLGAIVLIYLLIVINFQSWSDPFVIVMALPAAIAGIIWMLFATHTTLSVPALTGAIMCMGVATSNSVLVISFAREKLTELGDATAAALEAGFVRFRPVLMTALAMIIGMIPMALGMGEGGEQNAPLGRAVIGGLLAATFATLVFVPVVFSIVHGRRSAKHAAPVLSGVSHVSA